MKTVRIGGAAAFFSDSIMTVAQLLSADPCPDYLMFDFMSEGTIGIMAQARAADPGGGFMRDILSYHIAPNVEAIVANRVKLLANAGGLNPRACAAAIEAWLKERNVPLKVGFVEGDDILAQADALRSAGTREMFSGEAFPDALDSINVYLGAFPIAAALARGADIVVTGRCADSALGLAPLIHEFGWGPDDVDELAAGTLVGHLLECGCQVTGGTFTDWEAVPDWAGSGYPIAEVAEDGSCVITKPAGTGGLVSVGSVAEQLLYEVSDPQAYIVADVVCDFSQVRIVQQGPDRVAVSGARGYPATDTYKGVASHVVGWRGSWSQVIIGMDAVRKAERQGEAIIERGKRLLRGSNFGEFTRTHHDTIGGESAYGPRARAMAVREVFLRASVEHVERDAVELFLREASSTTSAMAPGSTATVSRALVPLAKLFLFLTPKEDIAVSVTVDGVTEPIAILPGKPFDIGTLRRPPVPEPAQRGSDGAQVRLIDVAWGRSGDKGNLFNVAIIARDPSYLPHIRAGLTEEHVATCFAHLYPAGTAPRVSCYDVPGFHAINFVLHDSMDGGILVSPRVDAAAKGMAQQLLEETISFPAGLLLEQAA